MDAVSPAAIAGLSLYVAQDRINCAPTCELGAMIHAALAVLVDRLAVKAPSRFSGGVDGFKVG
jgi:hypothetical protein